MDRAPAGVGYGEAVEFLRAVVQGGSGLGFYVSLAPSLFFFLCLSVSFLSVSLSLFLLFFQSLFLQRSLCLHVSLLLSVYQSYFSHPLSVYLSYHPLSLSVSIYLSVSLLSLSFPLPFLPFCLFNDSTSPPFSPCVC